MLDLVEVENGCVAEEEREWMIISRKERLLIELLTLPPRNVSLNPVPGLSI
ncbi:hypothetical protein BV349_05507 [Pseudomonas syringae pv. actinidiae]|nr:hypothetical protein BV349_05507 [Pseudomonas syringae pv. actinidiae]OSN65971.1 hypothetical protein BV351_05538 [Pseudomonas syringae pv. actinidiae]